MPKITLVNNNVMKLVPEITYNTCSVAYIALQLSCKYGEMANLITDPHAPVEWQFDYQITCSCVLANCKCEALAEH